MRYATIFLSALILIIMASFTGKQKLIVSSPAFKDKGMIPSKYTCEGQETSPPLHIEGIPPVAKSLAIILHDPDAPMQGGFTHWVVWNIDVMKDIPENFTGGQVGINSAKMHNYKGMCPPSGNHHYYFTLYALDTKLAININTDKMDLEKKMLGHIVAKGTILGMYQKSASTMK